MQPTKAQQVVSDENSNTTTITPLLKAMVSQLLLPAPAEEVHTVANSESRKWQASLMHQGKERCLGHHPTELEAARAYDAGVLKTWGLVPDAISKLNFPLSSDVPVAQAVLPSTGVVVISRDPRRLAISGDDGGKPTTPAVTHAEAAASVHSGQSSGDLGHPQGSLGQQVAIMLSRQPCPAPPAAHKHSIPDPAAPTTSAAPQWAPPMICITQAPQHTSPVTSVHQQQQDPAATAAVHSSNTTQLQLPPGIVARRPAACQPAIPPPKPTPASFLPQLHTHELQRCKQQWGPQANNDEVQHQPYRQPHPVGQSQQHPQNKQQSRSSALDIQQPGQLELQPAGELQAQVKVEPVGEQMQPAVAVLQALQPATAEEFGQAEATADGYGADHEGVSTEEPQVFLREREEMHMMQNLNGASVLILHGKAAGHQGSVGHVACVQQVDQCVQSHQVAVHQVHRRDVELTDNMENLGRADCPHLNDVSMAAEAQQQGSNAGGGGGDGSDGVVQEFTGSESEPVGVMRSVTPAMGLLRLALKMPKERPGSTRPRRFPRPVEIIQGSQAPNPGQGQKRPASAEPSRDSKKRAIPCTAAQAVPTLPAHPDPPLAPAAPVSLKELVSRLMPVGPPAHAQHEAAVPGPVVNQEEAVARPQNGNGTSAGCAGDAACVLSRIISTDYAHMIPDKPHAKPMQHIQALMEAPPFPSKVNAVQRCKPEATTEAAPPLAHDKSLPANPVTPQALVCVGPCIRLPCTSHPPNQADVPHRETPGPPASFDPRDDFNLTLPLGARRPRTRQQYTLVGMAMRGVTCSTGPWQGNRLRPTELQLLVQPPQLHQPEDNLLPVQHGVPALSRPVADGLQQQTRQQAELRYQRALKLQEEISQRAELARQPQKKPWAYPGNAPIVRSFTPTPPPLAQPDIQAPPMADPQRAVQQGLQQGRHAVPDMVQAVVPRHNNIAAGVSPGRARPAAVALHKQQAGNGRGRAAGSRSHVHHPIPAGPWPALQSLPGGMMHSVMPVLLPTGRPVQFVMGQMRPQRPTHVGPPPTGMIVSIPQPDGTWAYGMFHGMPRAGPGMPILQSTPEGVQQPQQQQQHQSKTAKHDSLAVLAAAAGAAQMEELKEVVVLDE